MLSPPTLSFAQSHCCDHSYYSLATWETLNICGYNMVVTVRIYNPGPVHWVHPILITVYGNIPRLDLVQLINTHLSSIQT